jgi:hypothetical protein
MTRFQPACLNWAVPILRNAYGEVVRHISLLRCRNKQVAFLQTGAPIQSNATGGIPQVPAPQASSSRPKPSREPDRRSGEPALSLLKACPELVEGGLLSALITTKPGAPCPCVGTWDSTSPAPQAPDRGEAPANPGPKRNTAALPTQIPAGSYHPTRYTGNRDTTSPSIHRPIAALDQTVP